VPDGASARFFIAGCDTLFTHQAEKAGSRIKTSHDLLQVSRVLPAWAEHSVILTDYLYVENKVVISYKLL